MKCRVTMKCPDSLQAAIEEMAEGEIGRGDPDDMFLQQDLDLEFESVVKSFMKKAAKWFRYGEYITVELDFDEDTCKVVNE